MKKWLIILILLSITILSGYVFFSNEISSIEEIEVQKYNNRSEEYGEKKIITDESSLDTFTNILNKANHEPKTIYDMAYHNDFKVVVTYKGNGTDVFFVWKSSGKYTHIIREGKNDSFKISNKTTREKLIQLLN
ncbi:hypothetical protein [Guptibacillus hwajinpoensis]|uniref:YhfM-like domain-containing protein n=2 Tax=Guptibacillus hwajinpoensis TaxID=208199 RepID=A0A0J6CXQ5_9BACL|nr:hypothetical protein [Alkalihalobacillus macyae]KMM37960.1 hypothetical protein AB986_01085 [Alkalihalobacillus macyae]